MTMSSSACAKCGGELTATSLACGRCGLTLAHADAFAARRTHDVPASLLVAWERVVEAWDDGSRHDDVVHQAALACQLAWASRQYRVVAPQHPGDPRIPEMQARLARMAETVALVGDAGDAARAKRRIRTVRIVIAVVLIGLALALYLGYRNFRKDAGPPAGAPPPAPGFVPSAPALAPVIRGPGR